MYEVIEKGRFKDNWEILPNMNSNIFICVNGKLITNRLHKIILCKEKARRSGARMLVTSG